MPCFLFLTRRLPYLEIRVLTRETLQLRCGVWTRKMAGANFARSRNMTSNKESNSLLSLEVDFNTVSKTHPRMSRNMQTQISLRIKSKYNFPQTCFQPAWKLQSHLKRATFVFILGIRKRLLISNNRNCLLFFQINKSFRKS